jgi:hypothetical protein
VFWTFLSSDILETREYDVSETGSVSVLRCPGAEPTFLRLEILTAVTMKITVCRDVYQCIRFGGTCGLNLLPGRQ